MPVIVVIPRQLDADLTSSPSPTIPFSAGDTLSLNISFQDAACPQGPVTVFLACTALNGPQGCILPLDTIVQAYPDMITSSTATPLTVEIPTQDSITPGLLLLVQVIAFDGTQMGSSDQLFQVAGTTTQTSTVNEDISQTDPITI